MDNILKLHVDKDLETLDPDDWEGMKDLGHRMVDDMLDYLRTVRSRPVFQPVPNDRRDFFRSGPPTKPQGAEAAYEDFREAVRDYPIGNIHPRFWGWVMGTGTPFGMLAEMLAAGMNTNAGFGNQAAVHVETQVINWLKDIIGFPAEASGILVTGCTVANLIGLTVARNLKSGIDVRTEGLQSLGRSMTMYGSVETHSSVQRALEMLGLGSDAFRAVPVHDDFTIRIDELEKMIAVDVAEGALPICVIANAGTVNSGAFDDMQQMADVCDKHDLWLHVDGAFGALSALSPRLAPNIDGIGRADSVAFDLHKWLHAPYDVGGVLIRDASSHHDSFRMSGDYLSHFDSDLATGPINFMEHGVQMSRSFRALKVWMTIKEHGTEKLGRLVEQNVDQAQYLAALVDREPELELMAPVPLNIVCFRYTSPGLDEQALDDLNLTILQRLHDSGVAVPTHTRISGHFVLRAAIANHRTRFEDLGLLANEVIYWGRKLRRESPRQHTS
ncbi:MAG: pyridoxal-dependent decarboxylase [bacterium]|nr:pyridoxal-dependent decarboxylase [bacterium]